jgi:hypothetical protein
MRLEGHTTSFEDMRYTEKVLIAKPEARRSFGRCRRRWEDNKINLKYHENI